jgi:hypothetical protein
MCWFLLCNGYLSFHCEPTLCIAPQLHPAHQSLLCDGDRIPISVLPVQRACCQCSSMEDTGLEAARQDSHVTVRTCGVLYSRVWLEYRPLWYWGPGLVCQSLFCDSHCVDARCPRPPAAVAHWLPLRTWMLSQRSSSVPQRLPPAWPLAVDQLWFGSHRQNFPPSCWLHATSLMQSNEGTSCLTPSHLMGKIYK